MPGNHSRPPSKEFGKINNLPLEIHFSLWRIYVFIYLHDRQLSKNYLGQKKKKLSWADAEINFSSCYGITMLWRVLAGGVGAAVLIRD